MKLLLFSDLHCSSDAARRVVDLSRSADVVVGAGDYATCRRGLQPVIGILSAIETPTVLTFGNSESLEELERACRGWPAAQVLHGRGGELAGQVFFGLGGGIPVTPFGAWSVDFSEAEAEALLAGCPPGCVLVSHSPPQGAVDVSTAGQSLGSVALRAHIEAHPPALVVCGHIHESAGQQARIGPTLIVNAGPAARILRL